MIPPDEKRIPLAQAARELFAPNHEGRPVHVSTVLRWVLHGVRGVKLEAVRVGGRWATTLEAIRRFEAACTAKYAAAPGIVDPSRERHEREIERELTAMGV
jgi:hypothetical protein